MSLTNKRIKDYIKDEKQGIKVYRLSSKKVKAKDIKRTFRKMANDEARHKKLLEKMLK
jgi:rubrerythrin